MTNFEKIKNMSVEELAQVMSAPITICVFCPADKTVCEEWRKRQKKYSCKMALMEWLKREVKE